MHLLKARILRTSLPILALLAPLAAGAAQTQPPRAAGDTLAAPASPRPSGERSRPDGPLLDVPISRTEYRLGAGDEVDVAIFGDVNEVFTLAVSPEGSILVPGVGIVPVLGLDLDRAEARVRAAVSRLYRNVEVRVALSRVRTFRIFVVGDVPEPGVRVATAATRVSEVVDGTGSASVGGERPRRRNVTLRRASGETVQVDLARFRQTGDMSANPTLREGDAVVVPTADRQVSVFGRVRFPGIYEYRPGESLADFLEVANGALGFPADAADSLRVVRFTGPRQQEIHRFSREEAVGAGGRTFRLEPFDGIYIPQMGGYMRQTAVTVQGEVLRPGTYPIRTDTTTVRELVAMAGGLSPRASLAEATLRRPRTAATPREIAEIPPEMLTPEERRILQIQAQSDPSHVVVDFRALLEQGVDAADQTLRPGDQLVIPERRSDVTVLGAVRTPGIVSHLPGGNVSAYVQAAGGYGRRADAANLVVLKGPTGTRTHWRDVRSIDPGDTVIVPFRERASWSAILRDTNAIVGTVLGLILAAAAVL